MSYYNESYYNEIYYGTSPQGGVYGYPVFSNAYQNNWNSVVFYWSFSPFNSSINNLKWQVELSFSEDFSNFIKQYNDIDINTNTNEISFINGVLFKGIVFKDLSILNLPSDEKDIVLYWRVRAKITNDLFTDWAMSSITIKQNRTLLLIQRIFNNIQDLLVTNRKNSNIYRLFKAICLTLNECFKYIWYVENSYFIDKIPDQELERVFGKLYNILKPANMEFIDYREILKAFSKNIRFSPSIKSMSAMIFALFRNYPTYKFIREELSKGYVVEDEKDTDYYVYDNTLNPPQTPYEPDLFVLDEKHYRFGVYVDIKDFRTESDKKILSNTFIVSILKKFLQVNANIYLRGLT